MALPLTTSHWGTYRVETDAGRVKRRRVIQLATGAWFDPVGDGATCRPGNPNAVTLDNGTFRLAQGSTAHSCVVQVERFDGTPPDVPAFAPPEIISDNRGL